MKNETGWRIAVVATCLVVALAAALLGGCGSMESSDHESAKHPAEEKRYEYERIDVDSYSLSVVVVTDTETRESWLIATCADGGVAIEKMTPSGYVSRIGYE